MVFDFGFSLNFLLISPSSYKKGWMQDSTVSSLMDGVGLLVESFFVDNSC